MLVVRTTPQTAPLAQVSRLCATKYATSIAIVSMVVSQITSTLLPHTPMATFVLRMENVLAAPPNGWVAPLLIGLDL